MAKTQKDEKAAINAWQEAIPNDRLAHLIKGAHRMMARALQLRLMEHSEAVGHWAYLRILWVQDGITQRALSELAGVREPTTFTALKAMDKLGYITRRKLPGNQRNICIFLTPKGKALKKALVPLAEEVNEIAVKGVPARDIATTRKTLLAILRNMAQDEYK